MYKSTFQGSFKLYTHVSFIELLVVGFKNFLHFGGRLAQF